MGNEFSSVEALWSQFENVMAKDPEDGGRTEEGHGEDEGEDEHEGEHEGEEQQHAKAEGSEKQPS